MKPAYKNIHQKTIDQCRKGSTKAQFELYKLYYKAMFNTSLRIVKNQWEAEDIMQEAFCNAFRNLKFYKGEVSFGAWLKRIVINKSLDSLRKKNIEQQEIDEQILAIPEETNDSIPLRCSAEKLRALILNLPDKYRIVFSLYLMEGYDHEEIASILNITETASRTHLFRAKQKLQQLLKEDQSTQFIQTEILPAN